MSDEKPVRFPDDTQHLLEIGRNGSGKTTAGLWHLSNAPWDRKPALIVDSKGDADIEKIGRMHGVKILKKFDEPLNKTGLHIIRPHPAQIDLLDDLLWRVHQRNNVIVFIDEGHSLSKSAALDALLTQGRSKHIPCTVCTQRPSWISRFCFSEASFFQVFSLTDRRDRLIVQQFIPIERVNLENRLPPFHSWWYDVKADHATEFSPVPPSNVILDTFRERLQPKRVAI